MPSPDDHFSSINLRPGEHYRQLGESIKAVEFFTLILEQAPNYLRAHLFRLLAYDEACCIDQVEEEIKTILSLAPDSAEAFFVRAYQCLWKNGETVDDEGAWQNLSKAIRLDPNLAEAYLLRAQLREEDGDFSGAIVDLSLCLKLEPRNSLALWRRAALWEKLGKIHMTIHDLETFQKFFPNRMRYRLCFWMARCWATLAKQNNPENSRSDRPLIDYPVFDIGGNIIKLRCLDSES